MLDISKIIFLMGLGSWIVGFPEDWWFPATTVFDLQFPVLQLEHGGDLLVTFKTKHFFDPTIGVVIAETYTLYSHRQRFEYFLVLLLKFHLLKWVYWNLMLSPDGKMFSQPFGIPLVAILTMKLTSNKLYSKDFFLNYFFPGRSSQILILVFPP